MPKEDSGYFGVRLGDAIATGAGHISEALQRKYAMQRRDEEMARQREEEKAAQNQSTRLSFAKTGIDYDSKNPAAAFEAYRAKSVGDISAEDRLREAKIKELNSKSDMGAMLTGKPIENTPVELATQYGIPLSRPNPYHGQSDMVVSRTKSANVAAANKEISSLEKKVDEMATINADMSRASEILKQGLNTGPIVGRNPFLKLTKKGSEFERIANTIIPKMRIAGSGTTSDRDMEIYKKSTLGLTQEKEVNERVIDQTLAINKRIADKSEFMTNYATVYGDLQGANSAWKQYVNSNPLFDEKGNTLTPKHYSEFFKNSDKVQAGEGMRQSKPTSDPMGLFND